VELRDICSGRINRKSGGLQNNFFEADRGWARSMGVSSEDNLRFLEAGRHSAMMSPLARRTAPNSRGGAIG
jgi:hypothetical protein